MERVSLDQFSALGQVSTLSASKTFFLQQFNFNLSLAFGLVTFTLICGICFEPMANETTLKVDELIMDLVRIVDPLNSNLYKGV